MRILTVVHDFLPRHFAGAEYMTYLLARDHLRRGHEQHLLFAERDTGRDAYSSREGEFDGLAFTEVAYDNIFQDYRDMYADPRMTERFAETLDRVQPELVHFQHTAFFGVDTVREAQQRGIPVVFTLHEYYLLCPRGTFLLESGEICEGPSPAGCGQCMRAFPIEPARYGVDPGSPSARADAFPRALELRRDTIRERLAGVQAFVAPSRFLEGMFRKNGAPFEGKLVWIPYGIPPLENSLPERSGAEEEIVFGFAGTLAEYKGVKDLIEAFLKVSNPNARLEVHGELSWFPDFAEVIQSLSRGDERIRFMGAFDPRDSQRIYARFDALVVPSRWYENWPVTIQEAGRQRLPVITTDLGGMREAVEHEVSGLLFERGNVAMLTRHLERFSASAEVRANLRAGIPRSRSDAEMGRDYEEMFARILSGAAS